MKNSIIDFGNFLKGVGSTLKANSFGHNIKRTNSIAGAITDNWDGAMTSIGDTVNTVTGTTANNNFNAIEAQKQRDWEERMSNTQYQRTVADMQAAGINPMALYGGAGLTTLGSSSAATSGSGTNIIGPVLNAITGIVKAFAGKGKVNKTFNYYKR